MNNISRVLVANRGEIAVRIIKACRDLGIESVAAVSEADQDSMAAKIADRVICIGPPRPTDSYLKADRSQAIERMQYALENFVVAGIETIIPFLQFILNQPDYRKGQVNTRWIESILDQPLDYRNNKYGKMKGVI